MNENLYYHYHFKFEDDLTSDFKIELEPRTLGFIGVSPPRCPHWTELTVCQCDNCPLTVQDSPYCPVALNMVEVIETFARVLSIENADITIETNERSYLVQTSVTRGISSLIGIIMVTSGCPIMDHLRPMVRFHLPFATIDETVYRSVNMYLMAQYFRSKNGLQPDWELSGLVKLYRRVHVVNRYFARRLQEASREDANINAIALLDLFAESIPLSIEQDLEEFQGLFEKYYLKTSE